MEKFNELEFCKRYLPKILAVLRSETREDSFQNIRALQELEEEADKQGKAVFIDVRLIDT